MKYYFNAKRKQTAAHIWVDGDTVCKMLSTGGLKPGKKQIHDETYGKRICQMCQTNFGKLITNS